MSETRARLVLITGVSGSGKSTVAKALEDLGHYCVDNLPLPLLRRFLRAPLASVPGFERISVVTDVRAPGFAEELPRLLAEVDEERIEVTLLFLEASEEVLVRRFSETRRPHPLAGDGLVVEGIRRERELLAEVRGLADLVFDSSGWSIHQMRDRVFTTFGDGGGRGPGLVVTLVSFGFKHGIPSGTDVLFDVRFLPNPHFVDGLREQDGRDPDVREFLEGEPEFVELVDRMADFLLWALPRYRREHRRYASIAIGCTGGRHRSVAAVERLARRLDAEGWPARRIHRDLSRGEGP